jgi:hypothetical protein
MAVRITLAAGTVKAGGYRDFPPHPQLIERMFSALVEDVPFGPLVHCVSSTSGALGVERTVSGRISTWLGRLQFNPRGVSRSHGQRHRIKTLGH